jgi:acetate kinase
MECLVRGKVDRIGQEDCSASHKLTNGIKLDRPLPGSDYQKAIDYALILLSDRDYGVIEKTSDIQGIGLKTVHGGKISGTVLIDEKVIDAMHEFCVVAPAHNNIYLEAIQYLLKAYPNTPLVAVFETGFHKDMPLYAKTYSVPYEWYEKYGICRYGFHGASHRYISERTSEIIGSSNYRLISCHLGGSSSICAVLNGKSIDTSMGFSNQSGLMMSNRVGDFDPYAIPYLVEKHNFTYKEIFDILTNKSGLLGISGISGDLRDLEKAAANGEFRAQHALDMFVYNTLKYIGAYVTVLGGLDVLAFTGGIGENSHYLRARICKGLSLFGVSIDEDKNLAPRDQIISSDSSDVKVLVIPANEELIIARETVKCLNN